jgi:hypothetical protein
MADRAYRETEWSAIGAYEIPHRDGYFTVTPESVGVLLRERDQLEGRLASLAALVDQVEANHRLLTHGLAARDA